MQSIVSRMSSRTRLSIIAAIAGAAVSVPVAALLIERFEAGTQVTEGRILVRIGLFVLIVLPAILLPYKAIRSFGPTRDLRIINNLFDALHLLACFGLALLAVLGIISSLSRTSYPDLTQNLFLAEGAIAIFPMRIGWIRPLGCWLAVSACLFLLAASAGTRGVLLPTLSAIFFAVFCTIANIQWRFPTRRLSDSDVTRQPHSA